MKGSNTLPLIKKIVVIGILLVPFLGYSQEFPFQVWHKGKIVLMNNDTLNGLVKYNMEGNVVQFDNKQQVMAFSSQKVLYYEISDNIFKTFRYFYSLPYYVQANYKTPILFEVLYEGPLTLLAREYTVEETIPQYGYYYRHGYASRTRLAFDYFFLDQKGNINKYSMKRNDLLEVMKQKDDEIKKYMKKNRLKYDRREDLVKVVAYYNALLEE